MEVLGRGISQLTEHLAEVDELRTELRGIDDQSADTPARYATRADYREAVINKLGEAIYEATEDATLLTLANVAANVTEEDIDLPEDVMEWMESFARQVHEQGISTSPSLRRWDIVWREPTVPQTFEVALSKVVTDYGMEVVSFNPKTPTPLTFEDELIALVKRYGYRYGQVNFRDGELTRCTLRPDLS